MRYLFVYLCVASSTASAGIDSVVVNAKLKAIHAKTIAVEYQGKTLHILKDETRSFNSASIDRDVKIKLSQEEFDFIAANTK